MSTRHERRRFSNEASNSLVTYLVDVDQPLDVPILHDAARHWLDALSTQVRLFLRD